jgi:two-component system response regulator AtoC
MFFGTNPEMQTLRKRIPLIAGADAPILIQGETGTGKQVLARELHAHSGRAAYPFVKLNCAALPAELLESELFGYERGSSVNAVQRTPGIFETAEGGTILLDDIGDIDIGLQAKLLELLQDHRFHRLGGKQSIRGNVRIMAATHRSLEAAIRTHAFREDLYYRLSVLSVRLPPLRERRADIAPLTELLMTKHAQPGVSPPALTPRLVAALSSYDWPGNILELENVVRRWLIFRDPEALAAELTRATSQEAPRTAKAPSDALPALQEVSRQTHKAEADTILATLHATYWNRKKAAAILQIDYRALLYKMKKLGIAQPGDHTCQTHSAGC